MVANVLSIEEYDQFIEKQFSSHFAEMGIAASAYKITALSKTIRTIIRRQIKLSALSKEEAAIIVKHIDLLKQQSMDEVVGLLEGYSFTPGEAIVTAVEIFRNKINNAKYDHIVYDVFLAFENPKIHINFFTPVATRKFLTLSLFNFCIEHSGNPVGLKQDWSGAYDGGGFHDLHKTAEFVLADLFRRHGLKCFKVMADAYSYKALFKEISILNSRKNVLDELAARKA